jgi:hypothetical protein
MENINEINIIVKDKKPTSEAVKRAKAKYYQKKKLDEGYMQDMRDRAYKHYYEIKERNRIKETNIYLPKVITE